MCFIEHTSQFILVESTVAMKGDLINGYLASFSN